MKKMFLVYGSSGEWSDRTEWPIRVVATEDRAKELVLSIEFAEKIAQARSKLIERLHEQRMISQPLHPEYPKLTLHVDFQESNDKLLTVYKAASDKWYETISQPIYDSVEAEVSSMPDDEIDTAILQNFDVRYYYRKVDVEL